MGKYRWTISGESEFTVNEECIVENGMTPEAFIEMSIDEDLMGWLDFARDVTDEIEVNVEKVED